MDSISLLQFLTSFENYRNNSGAVCFYAKSYPRLFFNRLFPLLKNSDFPVQMIGNAVHETHLYSLVNTLFLGKQQIYWLGNIDRFDIQSKKRLISFLPDYDGPHQLWYFSEKQLKRTRVAIHLPCIINTQQYLELYYFFYKKKISEKNEFSRLMREHTVSLDIACLLMNYQQVVGKNMRIFCDSWIKHLIIPEKSLFLLSEAFFAGKKKLFFRLWDAINKDYSYAFWIVYWSEQFFRAYLYSYYRQIGAHDIAKKFGFRLPFSFLNRDWKNVSLHNLSQSHQLLYQIEYQFKNGNQNISFDIVYFSFFSY